MKYDYKNNFEKILSGEMKVPYCNSMKMLILKHKIFEYKCSRCGISDWQGESISLEIDHISGNKNDNSKPNLRFLCPNCHSLTPTFRGRKWKRCNKFDEEKIVALIKQGKTIHQVFQELDIVIGGNYKKMYNIIRKHGIELPDKKDKAITKAKLDQQRAVNKIEKLKNRIELIKNSNIDFNKKGWGMKVSKLIGLTPCAALGFVRREMPEFANNCHQHEK